MIMSLETFEEKINTARSEGKPSILLANGFSQAWDTNIFNYQNLFNEADFGSRDSAIKDIFKNCETYDFEKIIKVLGIAEFVCTCYRVEQIKIDEIRADQEIIMNSLIEVISKTHPLKSSLISDYQYECARNFMMELRNVFTVNYDLLLYWIVNKNNIKPFGYHKSDGFFYDTWTNENSQSIFFLHGGLHIYDDGIDVKKHTFRNDINSSIVDQVRNYLEQGSFPLFVSEPTFEKKLIRIKHHPYLNYCFEELKSLSGTLFIYGHSMADNDRHIFDQINKSDVRNVFISIFGDEYSDDNREIMANATRFIDTKKIKVAFFDASSAPIWG